MMLTVPATPSLVLVTPDVGEDRDPAKSIVSWTADTTDVDGFELYRSISGIGTPDNDPRWKRAPPTNVTENVDYIPVNYDSVEVNHQRPFYYTMRAFDQVGAQRDYSDWSNVIDRAFDTEPEGDVLLVSATRNYGGASPSITLSWPETLETQQRSDIEYLVERKTREETTWTQLTTDLANVTSWTDDNVSPGDVYEYRVTRFYDGSVPNHHDMIGHVLAGVDAPLEDQRGTVLLVVDRVQAEALSETPAYADLLPQLERDLIGDGWRVARMNADPTLGPEAIKEGVLHAANVFLDSGGNTDLKAVFLFGNIAVPRSGFANPDGHASRALPADGYYGDRDGVWTDTADYGIVTTVLGDYVEEVSNVPGDGKFDPGSSGSGILAIANQPEFAVGRVDMSDFTIFPGQSETDLLAQYLEKLHSFRYGATSVQRRGFIDDHFYNRPLLNSASEWARRDFAAIFGYGDELGYFNIVQDDRNWIESLDGVDENGQLVDETYLWAVAQSTGSGNINNPQGVNYVAQRHQYVEYEYVENVGTPVALNAVFNSFFSSYTVDYDWPEAFLRTPLADDGLALVATWHASVVEINGVPNAGQPVVHRMGLGDTIGGSILLSRRAEQFDLGFDVSTFNKVHSNLLGDPTLRLHYIAPANGVEAEAISGGARITWAESPDQDVAGYHVYKGGANGRFDHLTEGDLRVGPNPFFDDVGGDPNEDIYMVRAIKLETTGSGTYWNASIGVFSDDAAVRAETLPSNADFDDDGDVDGDDFLAWQSGFPTSSGARHSEGDADYDGDVDGDDFLAWQSQFGTSLTTETGDFDSDSDVDGDDFLLWQSGFGITTGAVLTDGDGDFDGDVDGDDFLIWQSTFGSGGASFDSSLVLFDRAAQVSEIIISASNSEHEPFYFSSVAGSGGQLSTVPVGGADTISIVFAEHVNVGASDLDIVGLYTANAPSFVSFSYDLDTMTATWKFDNWALGDQYALTLDSDSIEDAEGSALDGEWTNPAHVTTVNAAVSEFPSGDGYAGGDFAFVMTLLAGDANLDNIVDGADYLIWQANYNMNVGAQFGHADGDGDGDVDGDDFLIYQATSGTNYVAIWILTDLDGDGDVDTDDAQIIADHMNQTNVGWSGGDVNEDGIVDMDDFWLWYAQNGVNLVIVS